MAQKTDNPASPNVSTKADPLEAARRLNDAIFLVERVYYDFPELEKQTDGVIDRIQKIRDGLQPKRKGNLIIFPGPRQKTR